MHYIFAVLMYLGKACFDIMTYNQVSRLRSDRGVTDVESGKAPHISTAL